MAKKKIYFLSDAHLGSAWHTKRCEKQGMPATSPLGMNDVDDTLGHNVERKLCRWLDSVRADAEAIYLLGDIFDYWFEYKYVVPRGFTRFLGKIAEITDQGIEVHFFIGNHDIWVTDYLQTECGMIVHTKPLIADFQGKNFFLAHGDGLGDDSRSFQIVRKIFHNKFCRKLYAGIHPRWTMGFAHAWSNHSRESGGTPPYMGEDKEHLVLFAKQQLLKTPEINYFIFGHRHIMLDLMIAHSSRVVILGDWIQFFSYGVFDGENFFLEVFE